jgi:CubicO group peptidase (beta-lactamase class C family)
MKKHTGTLYWSLSLLAATALFARPHPAGAQEPLDDRVASIVKTEILAQGVPGASVAVLRDGRMLLERAWGLANIDTNVSASAATTHPVGSVSKQFTAALLLRQVDRGRLALRDPIGRHLAGLTPEAGAMPIEQLLNHTSGLQRSVVDPERRFENLPVETLLAMAVRDNPAASPSTTFEYSNAGYTVLGVLVEKLYGKSYGAALHDEIAAPLGLTTLTKCAEPKPNQAAGYSRGAGAKPGPPPGIHHSQSLGADGICATAGDLVRWTHALHSGRVLSDASYQAMTRPRGAAITVSYGFGLSVATAAWGHKAIVHGGQSLTGHTAELNWCPEHKVAVALLYNAGPRVPGVSDLIPRIVLGVPLP